MSGIFSHLRVSSEYSISQGLLTIDQIVKSASKHSIPSVALTDKSNMFGLVKFFNKCEAAGIKPISGASIQLIFDNDENSHELLCLAKTNKGHKNLMKVISNAHNNSTYTSPVINFNELIELKNDIVAIQEEKIVIYLKALKEITYLMLQELLIVLQNILKMILYWKCKGRTDQMKSSILKIYFHWQLKKEFR